ncbi:MAG TPA: PilZ domain-containing protein [Bacillales bacterium]|nr:PilZ domain-containing protein [Bacillales bacterium]
MKIGAMLHLQRDKEKYRCRLVELSEDCLFIDLPVHMKTRRTSSFHVGDTLTVSYVADDGALNLFQTVVEERKAGRIPMLLLKKPLEKEIERIQRRQFVRIDGVIDVALHPLKEHFPPFTTTSLDISAGGMAVNLPKEHGLKENMQVKCWMVLPMDSGEIEYLRLDGLVVRILQSEDGRNEKASLKFIDMAESDRTHVIRYCFEQQLLLKRKGLERQV